MSDDDDDDVPRLSQPTLLALREFMLEQLGRDESDIKENWQLSQFWYDDDTIQHLSKATLRICSHKSKVALISCPSLYKTLKQLASEKDNIEVKLFEYDKRFSCFHDDFIFYDYREPFNVDAKYNNYFDVILMDPPFLSSECLTKTSETVKLISTINSKIILCTGLVMESLAGELLNLTRCKFKPLHKNNLANDFICLTNFGEPEI